MLDYFIIQNSIKKEIDFNFFDSIDSTNNYLAKQPFNKKVQVCFASEQTSGKGQQGRVWQGEKYGSILFSIRKVFPKNVNISGLSLVIALAIIKCIESYAKEVKLGIKWPNDIYCSNKKLAGILIENQSQHNFNSSIIGVGINYKITKELDCNNEWIDLYSINNNILRIEIVSAKIINNILFFVEEFAKYGFDYFQKDWQLYDILNGRNAKLKKDGKILNGKVCGVNNQGALMLLIANNIETIYSSENISYDLI